MLRKGREARFKRSCLEGPKWVLQDFKLCSSQTAQPGGWPQCLAGWPGQGLASLHYPRKVEALSYLCFSPHAPSFQCLQGPGASLHPAAHLPAPGYHSRHHSGVSECSRPFSVPQLQLQSQRS